MENFGVANVHKYSLKYFFCILREAFHCRRYCLRTLWALYYINRSSVAHNMVFNVPISCCFTIFRLKNSVLLLKTQTGFGYVDVREKKDTSIP